MATGNSTDGGRSRGEPLDASRTPVAPRVTLGYDPSVTPCARAVEPDGTPQIPRRWAFPGGCHSAPAKQPVITTEYNRAGRAHPA